MSPTGPITGALQARVGPRAVREVPLFSLAGQRAQTCNGENVSPGAERSSGAFNPQVDLITQRCKVDWLGQKGLSTVLQCFTLCFCIAISGDHDDWDVWP